MKYVSMRKLAVELMGDKDCYTDEDFAKAGLSMVVACANCRMTMVFTNGFYRESDPDGPIFCDDCVESELSDSRHFQGPNPCERCGRDLLMGEETEVVVADLDPGDPDVGPSPDIQEIEVHVGCEWVDRREWLRRQHEEDK
jgi:hypothetical protein